MDVGPQARTVARGSGGGVACSGNGRCLPMRELARLALAADGSPSPKRYGTVAPLMSRSGGAAWDADVLRGCACDEGWEGPDCSLRSCPWGSDPRAREGGGGDGSWVERQQPEEQTFECSVVASASDTAAALARGEGTFRLRFRGSLSPPIRLDATAAEINGALGATGTVAKEDVEVRLEAILAGGAVPSTACGTSAGAGSRVVLTFWG